MTIKIRNTDITSAGQTANKAMVSNGADGVEWEDITFYSAGVVVVPTNTDNGDGSVTIGDDGEYTLFDNADGTGLIRKYAINGDTFTLADLTTNYVVANYNSGTPIVEVITDVTLIDEKTIIPILTIFRNGIYLHEQDWNQLGLALSNKLHKSIVKTQRYRREGGLAISEYGTRNVALTAGTVWTGAVPNVLAAIASATDNIFLWYHSSGVWTLSVVTQYNNTQYDNGTNLATLTANRYAVNWVYRGVESQKHLYVVLGTGDYTETQAANASVPELPPAINSHGVLVGKIVVQKSATTATSILSAFEKSFTFATAGGGASPPTTITSTTSNTDTGTTHTHELDNVITAKTVTLATITVDAKGRVTAASNGSVPASNVVIFSNTWQTSSGFSTLIANIPTSYSGCFFQIDFNQWNKDTETFIAGRLNVGYINFAGGRQLFYSQSPAFIDNVKIELYLVSASQYALRFLPVTGTTLNFNGGCSGSYINSLAVAL